MFAPQGPSVEHQVRSALEFVALQPPRASRASKSDSIDHTHAL